MKLDDCHLAFRSVVTAPFEHDEPDDEWRTANSAGHVPSQLWDFYRATRYLSASALAGFSTPTERIVTVYFARLIRSVKACLADAAELRDEMRDISPHQYDPTKPYSNEFDRSAARKHRSAFRSLLVNLLGALDVIADTIAVVFPRKIPKLYAGGAAFTAVDAWLRKPHVLPPGLITPHDHFIAELHAALSPEVAVLSGPERDWLPLMRMYRNKVAHLGHDSYMQIGLQGKRDGNIAFFIPRSWPFVAEQYATTGPAASSPAEPVDFSDVLPDWLMHQDLEEYSEGAYRKVRAIIGRTFGVLHAAYVQLKAVPASTETLADLERNSQAYQFEFFRDAG